MHRVYICSNIKCYFTMQISDHIEGFGSHNTVMSSLSTFVLKKNDKLQEGEHGWFVPTTYSQTKVKPRTICYQEREDEEDMTHIDATNEYEASTTYGTWMRHAEDRSWFVGTSIVLHCEGCDSFIQRVIEVHQYL